MNEGYCGDGGIPGYVLGWMIPDENNLKKLPAAPAVIGISQRNRQSGLQVAKRDAQTGRRKRNPYFPTGLTSLLIPMADILYGQPLFQTVGADGRIGFVQKLCPASAFGTSAGIGLSGLKKAQNRYGHDRPALGTGGHAVIEVEERSVFPLQIRPNFILHARGKSLQSTV